MPDAVESTFTLGGHRLAYTVYGEGPRVIVLVHGLLLSQRMHAELAKALAARGNRVITLDLLGHGRSDRPPDMWRYSMTTFGAEVIALLDHLEVDEAVVLGTSLGANTALEAAALAPERLRGMVIEMPVLDHALLGCAIAFTPLMLALTVGAPGAARLRARHRAPAARAERGRAAGPVLRAHGAAPLRAPHDPDAGARDRPPVRRRPPVLRRRHARRGAPEGAAAAGELDPRAAARAGAAHERDRGVRGRVLAPAAGQAGGRRTRQRRKDTVRFAAAPVPAASLTVTVTAILTRLVLPGFRPL